MVRLPLEGPDTCAMPSDFPFLFFFSLVDRRRIQQTHAGTDVGSDHEVQTNPHARLSEPESSRKEDDQTDSELIASTDYLSF
mmetsp:Transcript_13339/g.26370  ORF Transcript_13339/g.26370 Transcript_13339/m.26370 type:complete len:82 (+) Transcript_13339:279-524(+)